MTRLVAIEIRRALARRAVRLLIAVALLGIAITGVLVFVNADPTGPSAGEQQQAERFRAEQVAVCEQAVETREEGSRQDCDELVPPATAFYQDERFKLVELWQTGNAPSVFGVTAVFLLVGGIIGGATFVGAEWKAGTVATALTWEPRRLRLLGARLLAAAIVAFVVAVLLHVLMGFALLPAAALRGTTEGTDAAWFRGVAGAVLRISGLTTGLAVVAGCLASIGRNSAVGIGVPLGYALVAERLVQQLRPKWRPWLVLENAVIVLTGRSLDDPLVRNTLGRATLVLVGYLVLVVGVALVDFRRRDIT